jgi:uncharacterized iron-regulated membrane protein
VGAALRTGFAVTTRRGRYRRDLDLHKVVGFAAAPFLAVWALGGLGVQLAIGAEPLRTALFLSGLSPLLLAVTGLSTWLFRRARRTR